MQYICQLTDLVPNTGAGALFNNKQVALFRLADGRVFAIDNYDPFSQANVLARGIVGDLDNQIVVASPIYKQHFNLISGQCLEKPEVQLAVYAVEIKDGAIYLTEKAFA